MVAPPQRAVQPGCLGLAAVLLALAALPWLLELAAYKLVILAHTAY